MLMRRVSKRLIQLDSYHSFIIQYKLPGRINRLGSVCLRHLGDIVPEAKRSGRLRGELADDVVTQCEAYSFCAAGNP